MGGGGQHPQCVFNLSWKPAVTLVMVIMMQELR